MVIRTRDRFLEIGRFTRQGDLMLVTPNINEFWPQTITEWIKQGAPEELQEFQFLCDFFQLTHYYKMVEIKTGLDPRSVDLGLSEPYTHLIPPIEPAYESRIIDQDERTITVLNEGGQTVRLIKTNLFDMPTFIDHPVKDRSTWKQYSKRLDANSPNRLPNDWQSYLNKMNKQDKPTRLNVGSLFGFLREWMGLERLLYTFYDDPQLIEEMMEHVCVLVIEVLNKVLPSLRVDFAFFWEDMAYKSGPLISPNMFRKFMVPRYKRITEVCRKFGVDIIFVDSDGNLNELIPLWLEGGVNAFIPLECAASNNILELRKKYGKDAIFGGGIDKRVLLKDKNAISKEVMDKVPPLLNDGGYFPGLDHLVPPNTPFENYIYFINTLRDIAGLDKLPYCL